MDLEEYDFSQSNASEQYNTLVLLDHEFGKQKLPVKPKFYILGGTALLFHGIQAVVTIDIDTANRLSKEIKEVVEPFISDNASEVATLAKNYEKRLIPYKPEVFKNIKVYILSLEDIAITKLGAARHKDIEDLAKTPLLEMCNKQKLSDIISDEFDVETANKLMQQLLVL